MVEHVYNSYKFAYESGFRNIFLCPNARDTWTEENLEKLHLEVNKIFTDILLHYMSGIQPIGSSQVDDAFKRILDHDIYVKTGRSSLGKERKPIRCGLGTTGASIAYDGKIFSCQEQDSRDTNDYFYIGNIYDGIDKEKHAKILADYAQDTILTCAEDPSLCDTCPIRPVCIDKMCPSSSYDLYGTFFKHSISNCKFDRWFIESASVIMKWLVNEDNQLFKKYLDNLFKKRR